MVPKEFGEGIGDAGEDGKEGRFKSADGMFDYFAAMDIRQENLESAVPLVNDGATILGAGLIVEDLAIEAVDFGFDARHDAVVVSHVMPVVA